MKTLKTITYILAIIAGLFIGSTCQAQTAQFFSDFGIPEKNVSVKVEPIQKVFSFGEHLAANGMITKVGDSYEIVIDSEFYGSTDRLIYFLMAHEFLGLNKSKTGLMNEDAVYRKLHNRDIKRVKRDMKRRGFKV